MKTKKLFIGVFAMTYLLGCFAFVVYVSHGKYKQSAVKNDLSKISFVAEKPEIIDFSQAKVKQSL